MIAAQVIARMPRAKLRLAQEGPTEGGTDAARTAAVAVAAELRLLDISEQDALALVTKHMPYIPGATPHSRVIRQLARSVRFAYRAPAPILSGCCRDPRPHSGNHGTGKLRAAFAAYCDDECARTCPMLRGIKNPERTLLGTLYAPLDQSSIWLHGGGLGNAGHTAFRLVALLALASGTEDVQASGDYLCMKSNGAYSASHLRRVLKRLHEHQVVTLLERRTGLRRIHAHDEAWIADKERELNVAGVRERNIADARRHSDEYHDWLARALSTTGDEEAIAVWDPEPAEVRRGPARPADPPTL